MKIKINCYKCLKKINSSDEKAMIKTNDVFGNHNYVPIHKNCYFKELENSKCQN